MPQNPPTPKEFLTRICNIQGFTEILVEKKVRHEDANADYAACFTLYKQYVLDELNVSILDRGTAREKDQEHLFQLAKEDIKEYRLPQMVSSIKKNRLFLDDLRRQASQVHERFVQETSVSYKAPDRKFAEDLIRKFYYPWQRIELASVRVQLESLHQTDFLQTERRKQIQSDYQSLFTTQFASSRKAGLDLQSDTASPELKATREETLKAAEDKFAAVRDSHLDLHKSVMKNVKDDSQSVHDRSREIGDKKRKVEDLMEEIKVLGQQLFEAQEKLRPLEEEKNRLEGQKAEILRQRQQAQALSEKGVRERDIQKSKILTGLDRRLLQLREKMKPVSDDIARISAKFNSATERLHVAEQEAISTNEMHTVVRSATKEAIHGQEQLNKLHAAAEAELKWLRSLGTNEKALNVYSTAVNISFDFFLGIGNIAAGKGCGPLGNTNIGKLVVGAASLEAHPLNCLCGVGADLATLEHIYDYDTGQLAISLKLGLTWGVEAEAAHLEGSVGLALVYDAAIVVEDDRRFRVVHTLDLKATAGFEIPVIFNTELEADLIKHKSVMDFTDVYHWAAWLSMRWAHAYATVTFSSLYDDDSEFLQPSLVDIDHLEARAEATPNKDEKTKKMLRQVIPYLREPIVRTESVELLSGYEVTAAFGILGAGFGIEKWADPKYRKRRWDENAREEVEVTKDGREGGVTIQLSAGLNSEIDISNTVEHSNPDMKGENITVTLTPQVPLTAPVRLANEYVDGSIANWIEEKFAPSIPSVSPSKPTMSFSQLLNTVKRVVPWDNILQILANSAFGPIQVCLYNSQAGALHKWVLLYWRRLFNPVDFNVSHAFPLGYGLNLVPGVSISLQRTYRERIGHSTFAYLPMVYDGFMNKYKSLDSGNPRPTHAQGRELWNAWARTQQDQLWRMMCNIARGEWVAQELRGSCKAGIDLVADLTQSLATADPNRKIEVVDIEYQGAFSKVERFLSYLLKNEYPKSDAWGPSKPEDQQKIRWSLNPYRLHKERVRHKSTQFKLDKEVADADKFLGHNLDLQHQIWSDVQWVPDSAVSQCPICKISFGMMTRKHHCRKCGNVICGNCSKQQLPFRNKRGEKELVRVCDVCFRMETEKEFRSRHYAFGTPKIQVSSSARKPAASSESVLEGYSRTEIARDGNCLFRSIAQAEKHDENAHHEYREKAVKHIRENLKHFQSRDSSINHAYLNTMARDATSEANWPRWGGGAELAALSRVLRRRIFVHIPGQAEFIEFAEAADKGFTPDPAKQPIHLCWEEEKHYTLLQTSAASAPQPQPQVGRQKSPAILVHMSDIQLIQEYGSNNCYIDSTLYAVLNRCRNRHPSGEEILNRFLSYDRAGMIWTVTFADGQQQRVERWQIESEEGPGPEWQKVFELACKIRLVNERSIENTGAMGQLNHMPRLFGWQAVDIPTGAEIQAAADLSEAERGPYYDKVRTDVVTAFGKGDCVTYLRSGHVTSLIGINKDGREFTFYNPVPARTEMLKWPEIESKLRARLEKIRAEKGSQKAPDPNDTTGCEFCAFQPA